MTAPHFGDDTLVAFLLDELPDDARAAAEEHAASCAACGALVGRMAAAVTGWRESALPEAPSGVLVRLLETQAAMRASGAAGDSPRWPSARANRAVPARARWRVPAVAMAAAAGIALVFLAGYATGHRSGGTDGATDAGATAPARGELPTPPDIAFQATPPMDAWFAASPQGWVPPRTDVRDSL